MESERAASPQAHPRTGLISAAISELVSIAESDEVGGLIGDEGLGIDPDGLSDFVATRSSHPACYHCPDAHCHRATTV
jgi:hypothetical protein